MNKNDKKRRKRQNRRVIFFSKKLLEKCQENEPRWTSGRSEIGLGIMAHADEVKKNEKKRMKN